ncbi:MAG: hypothetical protein JWR15_3547, partial [Prosthecobacter sp.]|nr:hypothetical protein [Prosthecobacter sp.]
TISTGRRIDARELQAPEAAPWPEILQTATSLALASTDTMKESSISGLLGNAGLVDEFLPDKAFEAVLLKGEDRLLVQIAANALVRRGRSSELAEIGFSQGPEKQLAIFYALSGGPVNDGHSSPFLPEYLDSRVRSSERKFWLHVIQTQPLQASAVLGSAVFNYPRLSGDLSRKERQSVIDYWQVQVERSERATNDFEMEMNSSITHAESVAFIAKLKDKADLPLLKALLRYRGYELRVYSKRSTGSETKWVQSHKHQFRVRSAAAEGLKNLGKTVPADLVFEAQQAD